MRLSSSILVGLTVATLLAACNITNGGGPLDGSSVGGTCATLCDNLHALCPSNEPFCATDCAAWQDGPCDAQLQTLLACVQNEVDHPSGGQAFCSFNPRFNCAAEAKALDTCAAGNSACAVTTGDCTSVPYMSCKCDGTCGATKLVADCQGNNDSFCYCTRDGTWYGSYNGSMNTVTDQDCKLDLGSCEPLFPLK